MRYYVLPCEGLSDDMRAALIRGLGLPPQDVQACERHCRCYGVANIDAFVEELGEAQAALATARILGANVMVDWRGRLCFDIPTAHEKGSTIEDAGEWRNDQWLAALFGHNERSAPTDEKPSLRE